MIKKTELVFWEYKQNWQTFSYSYQEKKGTQINRTINERGDIATDIIQIQRFIR